MRTLVVLTLCTLVCQPCCCRSLDSEESVVSVYTTQPTTAGTGKPLDVYHQIASNIAERITSPIYRFLGFNRSKTEDSTTKKTWSKIELLDDSTEESTKPDLPPVDNNISEDRDVEELSVEALRKIDKKPEKIVLYSSYLPVLGKLEANDTTNEIDDDDDDDSFGLDDVEDVDEIDARGNNYFVYILELFASFKQLLLGGLAALFNIKF